MPNQHSSKNSQRPSQIKCKQISVCVVSGSLARQQLSLLPKCVPTSALRLTDWQGNSSAYYINVYLRLHSVSQLCKARA
eukprot:1156304-Pelagomonas_calceolata.AAC.3